MSATTAAPAAAASAGGAASVSPDSLSPGSGGPTSYPKSKIKVLLLERISPAAVKLFVDQGYQVRQKNKRTLAALCSQITAMSSLKQVGS
jgi:hypothetical protein